MPETITITDDRTGKTVTYFRIGRFPFTNVGLWAAVAGLFFALAPLAMPTCVTPSLRISRAR